VDIIGQIPESLAERFLDHGRQDRTSAIKGNWKSIACMMCGACCCSSVVPISTRDLESFHRRLGFAMSLESFRSMFVADPETLGVNHTIETKRYGGRCMFLGKKEYFCCDVWDNRAEVCRHFLCWEAANFEKWMNGQPQDSFDNESSWTQNFSRLLTLLTTESPLGFFPESMACYMRLADTGNSPSWFETNRDNFI